MNAPGCKKNSLAALDRRLKKHGRRRTAVRSHSLGAGSAADVNKLIAIVKGKSPEQSRHGLAKLEQSGAPAQQQPRVVVRAYDAGGPIRGRGVQPGPQAVSGALAARHWFLPDERDNSASSFAVELFDEVTLPSTNLGTDGGLSTGPTAELTVSAEPVAPASAAPTFTVSDQREAGARLTLAASAAAAPLGLDLASTAAAGRAADADEFEREVQAILSGMKKRPPLPPEARPASAVPAADAQTAAPPPPRPHDIFERMGQNMAFANAFQLPAVELSKRFDALEAEVAREEEVEGRRADVASLELTDEDIAATLGLALNAKLDPPMKSAPLPAKSVQGAPRVDDKACPPQPPPPAAPTVVPPPAAALPATPTPSPTPTAVAHAPAVTPAAAPAPATEPIPAPPPANGIADIHKPLVPTGETP